MTVPSQDTVAGPYDGNDSTTSFPFNFLIYEDTDLEVIHTNASGLETVLILNSGYSVTFTPGASGGSVTYPVTGSPLPAGEKLTIARSIPATQTVDLSTQTAYSPETVEKMADRLTMGLQQLQSEIGRCVKVAISSGTNPDALLQSIAQAVTDAAASVNAAADQVNIATTKAGEASTSAGSALSSKNDAEQAASVAAGHAASIAPDSLLTKADNLNSVADKPTARKNLGLTGDDDKVPADMLNAVRKLVIQKGDDSLVEVVDVNGNINWDKLTGVPDSVIGSVNTVAIGNCGSSGNYLQVSRTGNDVIVNLKTSNCNCNCNCNCDCRDSCFAAGTLIAMADGSHKRIEDVVEGDVLAGMGGHESVVVGLHETVLGGRQMMHFPGGPTFSADHPFWIRQGDYEGWGAYQLGDPAIYNLDLVVKITDSTEFPSPDGWMRNFAIPVAADPETPLFHLITESGDYCVDGFVVSGGGQ